jgi:uncharacterized protein YcbK (DUF882 family)
MGDLSPHFSSWEFACNHCGYRVGPTPALLDALERLRGEVGRPLAIVSGDRCVAYNRRVGGIPRSQHLHGRAADIPGSYATVAQAKRAGFHGVGLKSGRVTHVDVTPGRGFFTFDE